MLGQKRTDDGLRLVDRLCGRGIRVDGVPLAAHGDGAAEAVSDGVVGLVLAKLLEQSPRSVVGQLCGEAPVVCHGESVADDRLCRDRHARRKLGEERVRSFLQLLLQVLVEELAGRVETLGGVTDPDLGVHDARSRGREHLAEL